MSVDERLERLERTCRRQRLALTAVMAVVVAVGCMGQAPANTGDIVVRSVRVVDAAGRLCVVMSAEDGVGRVHLGTPASPDGLVMIRAGAGSAGVTCQSGTWPSVADMMATQDGATVTAGRGRQDGASDCSGLFSTDKTGATIGVVRNGQGVWRQPAQ